jgi:hypothetical protein
LLTYTKESSSLNMIAKNSSKEEEKGRGEPRIDTFSEY